MTPVPSLDVGVMAPGVVQLAQHFDPFTKALSAAEPLSLRAWALLVGAALVPVSLLELGKPTGPMLRRAAVLVVGGVVLLAGLAMLVLPGPALLVIPLGLAILATEFRWARLLLQRFRDRLRAGYGRATRRLRRRGA